MEHMMTVTLMSSLVYVTMLPSANSVPVKNTHKERDMTQPASWSSEFECETPRPRVVRLTELTRDGPLTSNEDFRPPATVLHRCDESIGWCRYEPDECCGPTKTDMVYLVFEVMDAVGGSRVKHRRTLTGFNHTECGCMGRRGGGGGGQPMLAASCVKPQGRR